MFESENKECYYFFIRNRRGKAVSTIRIENISITDVKTDAVVNAANAQLLPGGGVCGAIFAAAGYEKLDEACMAIGGCKTGGAVITPGFDLNAKYIIHAVGPIWCGGNSNEAQLLYSAYRESLKVARENNCQSIAFPLISAGIYGYPMEEAWKVAINACSDFIKEHANENYEIVFAVLDRRIIDVGNKLLENNIF